MGKKKRKKRPKNESMVYEWYHFQPWNKLTVAEKIINEGCYEGTMEFDALNNGKMKRYNVIVISSIRPGVSLVWHEESKSLNLLNIDSPGVTDECR